MTGPDLRPVRPLPPSDAAGKPFRDGLTAAEIRLQRCTACGSHRFPPSRTCPACRGVDHAWVAVEPTGTVESFCVFHKAYFPEFAAAVPYTVIQVRLDCGVRVFSNPMDIASADLAIGMRVSAVFEEVSEGITLLKFRAASTPGRKDPA